MNIITGYRGIPHITSDQDRAKNQGAFGTGSYILDVGEKMAAEIVSANEIRIRDGVLSMQGCVANIAEGAYDSCDIQNGTQGMQRRDLIVARYTKDAETNVEDIQLVVIEGTPASSSPSDPAYNDGDIQAGDSPVDFPLYRVNISGVTISSVTRLAPFLRTQAETDDLLGNTSITGIDDGTLTGAISTLNSNMDTLDGDLDTFIAKFTRSTAMLPVSAYQSRVDGIAGGYMRIGNLVFVSIIARTTTAISNAGAIITGFPKPYSVNLPLVGVEHTGYTNFAAFLNSNGNLCIGALSSGIYFTLGGVYICAD